MEPTNELIELLKRNVVFQEFSEEELEKVFPLLTPMHVGTDEAIIHQGDLGNELYIIASGAVEVVKKTGANEHMHQLAVLRAGDNFGELALLGNGYRSATVRATEPTDLLVLSADHLTSSLEDPLLTTRIYKGLAQQLNERLRLTNEAVVAGVAREQTKERSRLILDTVLTITIVCLCLISFYIGMVVTRPGGASGQLAACQQRIILH
jgi:CRP/FNR family cyclic AMP-dependent transcriptional regulator